MSPLSLLPTGEVLRRCVELMKGHWRMQPNDTTVALEALFRPNSIAVIGATERRLAVGERLVRYLLKHGYKGRLFPLNPKYDFVMGLPCFPDLGAVPDSVDLALIALS